MTKTIIISGVSGQDGSLMADYLLAHTDHLILGMVRQSASPNYDNIREALANPRFSLVTGDLSDSQSIDNLVKEHKPDYFINLAAQSFVGASWQLPEQTFDVDAAAIIRILEAIRKHVPHCRFYNAGSSEEFGEVEYSPQDEKHPLRPQSPYGAAKASARQLVRVYRKSYGLYAIQGILFNHEGPRRGEMFVTRKITKAVARIAKALKEGERFDPLELGNLDAKRDWSDASDFVEGIWWMLNQEPTEEHIAEVTINDKPVAGITPLVLGWEPSEYVLSSNETHSIREFVEHAFAVAGIKGDWFGSGLNETYRTHISDPYIRHFEADSIAYVRINAAFYRPAEVEQLWGDSSRARKELGWAPKIGFDELVRRMVENDIALLS